jgi:hypothetical protein
MTGGALGLAVLASIASTRSNDLLKSGASPLNAQVDGLQLSFLLAAAIALSASLFALLALQRDVVGEAPAAASEIGQASS